MNTMDMINPNALVTPASTGSQQTQLDVNTDVLDQTPVEHTPIVKRFSDAGNAFIEKYTHPPSGVADFRGLPDLNNFQVAPVEWRNLDICNVTGRGYIGTADSEDFLADNYLLLTPSGARVTTIGFASGAVGASGFTTSVVQDLANTFVNDNYDFDANWLKEVASSRMVAGSVTTDLNATAFGDKGLVSAVQFRPTILFRGPAFAFMEKLNARDRAAFIKAHKGLESPDFKMVKKFVNNGSNADRSNKTVLVEEDDIEWSTDAHIQIFQLNGFNQLAPTSPGQVLQMSRKSYGGEARKGSFSVQRYVSTDVRWMDNPDTLPVSTLFTCYACHRNTDGTLYFVALLEPQTGPTPIVNAAVLRDTMWHEMTWVWTTYFGINRASNTSAQRFADAAPIIKRVAAFELQPTVRSPFNAFMQQPPEPDLASLQEASRMMYFMPDAVPSKYNFLGSLFNIAKSVVLPALKPLASKFLQGGTIAVAQSTVSGASRRRRNRKSEDVSLARSQGVPKAVAHREIATANRLTAISNQMVMTPKRRRRRGVNSVMAPMSQLAIQQTPRKRPVGMPRSMWKQIQSGALLTTSV
jgi:hypothetical protein